MGGNKDAEQLLRIGERRVGGTRMQKVALS